MVLGGLVRPLSISFSEIIKIVGVPNNVGGMFELAITPLLMASCSMSRLMLNVTGVKWSPIDFHHLVCSFKCTKRVGQVYCARVSMYSV